MTHRRLDLMQAGSWLKQIQWEDIVLCSLVTIAKTWRRSNVGLMLVHRLQRCPNIISTLGKYHVFTGVMNFVGIMRLISFISLFKAQ